MVPDDIMREMVGGKSKSLEERLQDFANALEKERDLNWKLGEIVLEAVREHGKSVLSSFAQVANCSLSKISQLATVAAVFPPEQRSPEHSWSFHQRVYYKARQNGIDPVELLDKAIANDWSLKNLAEVGNPRTVGLSRECPDCGARIEVRAPGEYKGTAIFCPVCWVKRADREAKLPLLGVLE